MVWLGSCYHLNVCGVPVSGGGVLRSEGFGEYIDAAQRDGCSIVVVAVAVSVAGSVAVAVAVAVSVGVVMHVSVAIGVCVLCLCLCLHLPYRCHIDFVGGIVCDSGAWVVVGVVIAVVVVVVGVGVEVVPVVVVEWGMLAIGVVGGVYILDWVG